MNFLRLLRKADEGTTEVFARVIVDGGGGVCCLRIPWGLAAEAMDVVARLVAVFVFIEGLEEEDPAAVVAGLLHFLVNCDNSGGSINFSGPFFTTGALPSSGTGAFEIIGALDLLTTPIGPIGLPILRSPNLFAVSFLNLLSLSSSVSILLLSSANPPGAVIVASLLNFSTISLFNPPFPSLHPPPLRAVN